METLASIFNWINELLGVSSAGELVLHPVFIGFCVILLLYAFLTGQKFIALAMVGLIGGGIIVYYMYPTESAGLAALLKFIAVMGGLVLLLIYFAFIRD